MTQTGSEIKRGGGAMMVLGVLQVLGGFLAIGSPFAASGAVAWIIGFVMIVVGLFGAFSAFQAQTFWSGLGDVLGGLLYLVAGAFVLVNIQVAMVLLGTLLAIFLIARGVIQSLASLQLRPERGWGQVLFGGVMALALGVMLLSGWPLAGAMAIGIFIGIELLWSGWTLLFVGGAVRGAGKQIGEAAAE